MEGRKIFNNAKWIIICKVIQSLLQFVIGMISARYLGPSNYGLINYAASIVAFALPIMKLGFDATLVYEFTQTPEKEGEILGTSLLLNIISSIACIFFVFAFVKTVNTDSKTTIIVCFLYSLSLFFSALEMAQYWFQYRLKSKYPSLIMLFAYVIVSAYKIYLLITQKSVYWFAVSNSLDYGIIGLSLIFFYIKLSAKRLSFSFNRAKSMLFKSKHYILSSLMVVAFQTTDHIMLSTMIGQKENGYYTAAVTCNSVTQFIFIAIIDSFRPLILKNKKENPEEYKKNISQLYSLILYAALAQSLVFSAFAGVIINILYGKAFISAVPVLRVLTWYYAFSFMGVIRNLWILAEQRQKYLWIINSLGAVINITLNIILIPLFGAVGAAITAFTTQFFINFLLGFIMKPIRENNKLLLKGLNPKFAIKECKNIIGLLKPSK